MYHKHHTKGLVLSIKNEGLDSLRGALFTENFGLLSVKIQGARALKSRLRFGVQEFSLGEFSLVHGRTGWKVVSARPIRNFFEALDSKPKIMVMGNVLSLVRKLSGEENAEALFVIVSNFLDFLLEAKEELVPLAECLVLLRILHSLGYLRHDPELSLPISSVEISTEDLESLAPRRAKIIRLLNESLTATGS